MMLKTNFALKFHFLFSLLFLVLIFPISELFAETPTVSTNSGGLSFTNIGDGSQARYFTGSQSDKLIFTFNSHSFYFTDWSELGLLVSAASHHVYGIPSTPTSGYDATINLIPAYGFSGTHDLYNNIANSQLYDDLRAEPERSSSVPYLRIDYKSSTNTIRVSYDDDTGYGFSQVTIQSDGTFSESITFQSYQDYTLTAASNTAPVANAGPDQTVAAGATVTLDGTGSSDADSNSLTYAWTQTSGTTVNLSSSTASQPTFTAPTAVSTATLIFSLVVTDSIGDASSADTVTITVNLLDPTVAFNQVKSEIDTLVNDAAFTSMQNHHQVTNTLSSAAVSRAMNNSCGTFKDQFFANVNSNSDTSTAKGKITWSSIKDTSRYVKHQSIEFIHRDLEDGPNTSHLSFTLQWEDCTRDTFLWGYFAGAQAENSDLENSTFTDGEYNSTGLKVGSYFVKSLHQNAFWNGIISAPYNFNKMTLNTSLMHASSDYETKMISAGTGLTGKIAYKFITFKPNVNLRYSAHQSEQVKFIASVGSQQSDNFIDLDRLEQITLRVRPSFILALNQSSPEFTPATLTIDPELSCDQKVVGTNTQRCTQGISIGLTQIFSNDVKFSLETGVQSNNDRNTHHFRTNIQIPF